MEPFVKASFDKTSGQPLVDVEYVYAWPFAEPAVVTVPQAEEMIPPGELAMHRGAQVNAADGRVGRVDEFLVSPPDGHITHLVLREGHLWGRKDVTIPVSQTDHIAEDTVYLKLTKREIEQLPSIPIKRRTGQ
jgi:hypothetical protein